MVTTVHDECGAEVTTWAGMLFDPDGAEHMCRDYVAWHQPPDHRNPDDLDVEQGWKPRRHRWDSAA